MATQIKCIFNKMRDKMFSVSGHNFFRIKSSFLKTP